MKRRGRPVLGAFSGFFTGLFLGTTLLFFGVVQLDSIVLVILPVAGLIVVPLVALFAPIGGRGAPAPAPAAEVPITPVDEPPPPPAAPAEPAAGGGGEGGGGNGGEA